MVDPVSFIFGACVGALVVCTVVLIAIYRK